MVNQCREAGLETELCATAGNPIILARSFHQRSRSRPHFLVYGHYDVQPAEPFDLWHSAPFEPRIQGRSLFARGACDNKGQHLAHLKAVEAYLQTGAELPCDLTFLIEGEEEIGPGFPRSHDDQKARHGGHEKSEVDAMGHRVTRSGGGNGLRAAGVSEPLY